MTDEPDSIVLRYLRRMDEKLDRVLDDHEEIKQRLGALEEGQASLSRRVDRLDARVSRIEKRLDLVDHGR
jgi:predicted nuclease with TOPRIM domain